MRKTSIDHPVAPIESRLDCFTHYLLRCAFLLAGRESVAATPIDYERIIQEVYEAVLRVGDTAVDIGAHLGRHTLPMARCGCTSR